MFAAALVPLGLLEIGLRVGRYGSSYPLFVPYGPAAGDLLVPNPSVGMRYFPDHETARRPPTDFFRAAKPSAGYRVFVQGASSAAGWPYSFGGAFSQMLKQRLDQTLANREVEVVNTAITATSSYTLLDLADEIIEQQPDAVLIYAGHNEYYGIFGVGSSVSLTRSPTVVRAYLSVNRWRTIQLLRSIGHAIRSLRSDGALPRTLMEELAGEQLIPYGSSLYEAGLRQFRSNLRLLLAKYRAANVTVYIGTVASNERDLAPFVGIPGDDAAAQALVASLNSAQQALETGDTAATLNLLRAAVREHPTAADPRYAVARLLDRTGQHDSARTWYLSAKDRDQLLFRAPEAINMIIREEAEREGAMLVDVQARLAAASTDGIIGDGLMLEHVHPNIEGQFLIADAFYEALFQNRGPNEPWTFVPADSVRRAAPVTAIDSMVASYYVVRLKAGFPFERAGAFRLVPPDTMRARDPVEAIALDFYRGRTTWITAQQRLAAYYRKVGNVERAIHVDQVLAQELSFEPGPLVRAAFTARLAGDLDRAHGLVLAAQARRSTADGLRVMASIQATRGHTADARVSLQQARDLAPNDRRIRIALEALEAVPGLERTARERPEDPDVLVNLGSVYYLTGQYERSLEMAARALSIDPNHTAARELQADLDEILGS